MKAFPARERVLKLRNYMAEQGLGRHEEPFLIFDSDLVLEENMVFTVEPGIYIPSIGGFRHSDTLIITKDGYEHTTGFKRLPEELIFS